MKKYLCCLIGLIAASGQVSGAQLDTTQVSVDSKWGVHLDVDTFKASKIGSRILNAVQKEVGQERLDAIETLIGFDPQQSLRGLTLYGNGEDENAALVIDHAIPTKKVIALLVLDDQYEKTPYGDHVIHSAGKGKERGHLCFVDDHTAVLAPSAELIKKAISVLQGGGSVDGLPNLLESVSSKVGTKFVSAYANITEMADLIKDSNVQTMREVALVFGENGENLRASLAIATNDEEAAKNIEAMINGVIGLAALAQTKNEDLQKLISGIKTKRSGASLSVDFTLKVDHLFGMLERLDKK